MWGGGGGQPQLTFEGCKLLWQVLFITVFLVTEKLLQSQEDSAEHRVSRQDSPAHRPAAPCLLPRQLAGLGGAGQEDPMFVLASCQPSGQICRGRPVGKKYAGQLRVGPEGLL